MVMINSGKLPLYTKYLNNFLMKTNLYIVSKNLLTDCLLIIEGNLAVF